MKPCMRRVCHEFPVACDSEPGQTVTKRWKTKFGASRRNSDPRPSIFLNESPDMMNIYNGNVTTDSSGVAVVTLPGWFEALNRDFRYQLTVIGQSAQAVVASKVNQNQ